jgi:circadian clock protein KaiC
MMSSCGVNGLDDVLHGGLPRGRTTVVSGGTGSGKTVLASQFLRAGAVEHDEPGLMILFEESPAAVAVHFPRGGWPPKSEPHAAVHFIDGRLPDDTIQSGTFDLGGLIAIATSLAEAQGVKRLVIDGIDALFATVNDVHMRRRELTRLLDWLAGSGLTTLLTVKTEAADSPPFYYDLAEFAADGVIALRSTMVGELLRRTLRVVKMRGSGFISGAHLYVINELGLRVLYAPSRTRWLSQPPNTRLSTGIERLDLMLQGGYRVGTATLVSGTPGSAKTTLCAAFLEAGIRNGERCLYVGFDEPAEQVVADAHSVGIRLDDALASGLLHAESYTAASLIAEEHYVAIETLIMQHDPSRVVIDPVSALDNAGGGDVADMIRERLVVLMKSRGITALFTAAADVWAGNNDLSRTRIATICDSWIHLGFTSHEGERNRTLAVLKARGCGHSNQIRELLLSADGIDLADVYTAPGDVLSGTARMQHEQEIAVQREVESKRTADDLASLDRERDDLARALAETQRRLVELARDRADKLARVKSNVRTRAYDTDEIRTLRGGDPDPDSESS